MPLNVAINAVSVAPGGGMTVLLSYLAAWRRIDADISPTIFASRQVLLDALGEYSPWAKVEPFATGSGPVGHFLCQRTLLARRIELAGADVVLTMQNLVGGCKLPQVVFHQNLLRFPPGGIGGRLFRFEFLPAARDLAAREALARSAANVFISDYLKAAAEKFIPHCASRNYVIHNGLSRKVIDAAATLGDQYLGQPEIFAIQSTSPYKCNNTLIEMLASLVTRWSDFKWRLTIAGGGDWSFWRKMADRMSIGDRVEFIGFQDANTLIQHMRRALCLVYPSMIEGFGMPPLEAMALRCPVVAADCTAIPEVVGQAGLLVPPKKAQLFADAVHRIYAEPGLRGSLIAAGLERIKSFCLEDSAVKMLQVLAGAAGRVAK